jgi:hypothetical protein
VQLRAGVAIATVLGLLIGCGGGSDENTTTGTALNGVDESGVQEEVTTELSSNAEDMVDFIAEDPDYSKNICDAIGTNPGRPEATAFVAIFKRPLVDHGITTPAEVNDVLDGLADRCVSGDIP